MVRVRVSEVRVSVSVGMLMCVCVSVCVLVYVRAYSVVLFTVLHTPAAVHCGNKLQIKYLSLLVAGMLCNCIQGMMGGCGLLTTPPQVEVHTVDRYQGRDKSCIIVSFVRSNPDRQVSDNLSFISSSAGENLHSHNITLIH